ncbi:hypothetical protein BH23BAC1_BH23BAC1_10880 [soil metagenome]
MVFYLMNINSYLSNLINSKLKLQAGVVFLLVIHVVGFLGLSFSPYKSFFQNLTPLNLILSAFILFTFHKDHNFLFYLFCLITFLIGFFVEVLGIQTGIIFGNYQYGRALGLKIWETPLIIGLNWLLLIYTTGFICSKLNKNIFLKAISATILMLLLDILIEPVAIKLDFWKWGSTTIPLQNYVAWGIVSFSLLIMFYLFPFKKSNSIAGPFYLIMLLFFILTGFFV